ncbi:S1 family peptidase [Microlunatus soli]|uniref:Streptogrisin C n=1 Tax=Microlunatus soli TaxID=630515 RepID=A0A1H1NIS7_9ACTN|nr:S1 family peptidase [Microlunatus soli]SDR98882.1 streptogrisin C [Microlunatus soli]
MLRPRMRLAATLVGLLTGTALAFGSSTIAEAEPSHTDDRAAGVRALAHHLDIGTKQAASKIAKQNAAGELGARLQREVGAASAGHYVDAAGRAVVNVTTEPAAATVRAGGGVARVVPRSLAQLESTKADLDRLAQEDGAGRVQSWGLDIKHNRISMITTAGATDDKTRDFLAAVSTDDAITVSTTEARMQTMDNLYGGQQIEAGSDPCSLGFNARDSSGNAVLLTAGHCGEGYATFSADGVEIGTTTNFTFPGVGDFAEATITNGYWQSRAAVRATAGEQVVSGSTPAAVGSAICKSGRTTNWTCGTIETVDNTVNYDNGDGSTSTVTGLIQTSACAEGGDSGAANLSGDQAQGLTSGGAGYDDDGNPLTPPVCGAKVGKPSVSFVQPINEVLTAYRLRLVTDAAN